MRRPSRRNVLLATAVVAIALLVANVAGIVRYPGGPVRLPNADWPLWVDHLADDQGNSGVGLSAEANIGTGVPMYIGVEAANEWPWTATIEGVHFLNQTAGLRLVETRLVRPGAEAQGAVGVADGAAAQTDPDLRLYSDYDVLPGSLAGGASHTDGRMWLEFVADQPGEQSVETIFIDYRVGPFSFTVNMHLGFSACVAPMPAGAICPWDAHG